MKVKTIPSSWLIRNAHRLDCNPYMSGGVEAKVILENLPHQKQELHELTKGHNGGVFNGPKFSRTWVDNPQHGVPFVGSSAMLKADLSHLPYLQNKRAHSNQLGHMGLKPGMTLISCSGTIGRMVYCRPDMKGIWSSQHIMKVVPDEEKIPPGYIYAYLSSKFGLPLVISGTFGSIIQSIMPRDINNLPVPRFEGEFELRIHNLVQSAANMRTDACSLLNKSESLFLEKLDIEDKADEGHIRRPLSTHVNASILNERFDAYYFSNHNLFARKQFDCSNSELKRLGSVSEVFIPGIFKRLYTPDSSYGYPYITGADVFQLSPISDRYLMKSVAEGYNLVLKKGMIVIQEAGQLGGLIGHSVMVGDYLDGFACTNNMIRVQAADDIDSGYLYTLLASQYGVSLITRESAGSSIPHIEEQRISNLEIPWPERQEREAIGKLAIEARDLRDEACRLENDARALVEEAIEGVN